MVAMGNRANIARVYANSDGDFISDDDDLANSNSNGQMTQALLDS